jgi:hypothetical protein
MAGRARRPVRLRRLDDLVRPDHVAFVKCDVEGHKLEVLKAGSELVSRRPTMLMEIEQRYHDEPIQPVFEHLQDLGYDVFAVRPQGLTPLDDFDVHVDQTSHLLRKTASDSSEPAEYVKDFMLVPTGVRPGGKLLAHDDGRPGQFTAAYWTFIHSGHRSSASEAAPDHVPVPPLVELALRLPRAPKVSIEAAQIRSPAASRSGRRSGASRC